MNDFFTWTMLATSAGCTLATGVVTQFFKDIIKIPTQVLSYLVAVIILLAATCFVGPYDIATFAIIPLNGIIVSLASNGGYEVVNKLKK